MGSVFPIRVRRLTADGQLRVVYPGRVLEASPEGIVLEAYWERPPLDLGYTVLEPADRFVEYFFRDRWFVIYEIHHHQDNRLKGWYCDIIYPPRISEGEIEIRDLALDLFVTPAGEVLVLDEEEFEALGLRERDPSAYEAARSALQDLLKRVHRREHPFHQLPK
ncbi:MAG: DUF402 domain-containing protein [Anaerolineae bacterium]|uniref:DUF402 domain-containing protein n=1 Tax=Thermoflexus sp. TaxID=1969742 RepID=UPI0025D7485B|nr:DUF402 domain-containing protein [Thermoflexus sp.]MCS7351604.1 DUF402 domain-containing protein [Thermoflexus sp.]MDW8181062.1 DUF402 domain-containing protein [Anaerolineae bacterium]